MSEDYTARIEQLRGYAAEDGAEICPKSEADFLRLVARDPEIRRADIVLMDCGNLRAVWHDFDGSQVGIQFLGRDMVQYVVLGPRVDGGGKRVTASGTDTFFEAMLAVAHYGQERLLVG